jgi:hypothetical protein
VESHTQTLLGPRREVLSEPREQGCFLEGTMALVVPRSLAQLAVTWQEMDSCGWMDQ